MAEIVGTIGKYGLLVTLAAFTPPFVHGAMAGALGLSEHPVIVAIQVIAFMAIVAHWTREGGAAYGLMAGLGIASGVYLAGFVRDLALEGLKYAFSFYSLLPDYILRGFVIGVVSGFAAGVTPAGILVSVLGFIIGAVVMLLIRAASLLAEALDLAVGALARSISLPYLSIIAPYLGGLAIGIPLSLGLLAVAFALAFGVGFAVGLALSSLFVITAIWAFASLILYNGLLAAGLIIFKTFTKSRDVIEILLDMAALFVFKFLGPALYSAGYAALTTRRKSTALYLVGLGAIAPT